MNKSPLAPSVSQNAPNHPELPLNITSVILPPPDIRTLRFQVVNDVERSEQICVSPELQASSSEARPLAKPHAKKDKGPHKPKTKKKNPSKGSKTNAKANLVSGAIVALASEVAGARDAAREKLADVAVIQDDLVQRHEDPVLIAPEAGPPDGAAAAPVKPRDPFNPAIRPKNFKYEVLTRYEDNFWSRHFYTMCSFMVFGYLMYLSWYALPDMWDRLWSACVELYRNWYNYMDESTRRITWAQWLVEGAGIPQFVSSSFGLITRVLVSPVEIAHFLSENPPLVLMARIIRRAYADWTRAEELWFHTLHIFLVRLRGILSDLVPLIWAKYKAFWLYHFSYVLFVRLVHFVLFGTFGSLLRVVTRVRLTPRTDVFDDTDMRPEFLKQVDVKYRPNYHYATISQTYGWVTVPLLRLIIACGLNPSFSALGIQFGGFMVRKTVCLELLSHVLHANNTSPMYDLDERKRRVANSLKTAGYVNISRQFALDSENVGDSTFWIAMLHLEKQQQDNVDLGFLLPPRPVACS